MEPSGRRGHRALSRPLHDRNVASHLRSRPFERPLQNLAESFCRGLPSWP
ncbi:hypothetical protein [Actinacidiphila sp. bgisy160]